MYPDLIDVVESIVKTYGSGIVSDSKFWNILADSYSFGLNHTLKDKFREYLRGGYASQLALLKGNREASQPLIDQLVRAEIQSNPAAEEEAKAVLFSVAIALGSATRDDYRQFKCSPIPASTPQPKPNPHPKPKAHPQPAASGPQPNRQAKATKFSNMVTALIAAAMMLALIGFFIYKGDSAGDDAKQRMEKLDQMQQNQRLREERSKEDIELSFKGIALGESYDAAVKKMKASKDFRNGKERYYSIPHDSLKNTFDFIRWITIHQKPQGDVKDRCYTASATLDKYPVEVSIYEYEGKVPLILIRYNFLETDYSEFLLLYIDKYGDPEKIYNHKKSYTDYYTWTYKNGLVQVDINHITYVTPDFIKTVEAENEKWFKDFEDLKASMRRQDSIDRAERHQKAINDI